MEKMQEAKALDHQREIKIAELNAQVAGVNAEVNAAREKHLADQETAKQLNLTTSMQAMHLQVANMKVAALAREMSATLVATAVDVEDIEGQHGATPVEGQHEVVPVDLAPAVEGQHEAIPVVEGQHEAVPVVEGQHEVVPVVEGQHEVVPVVKGQHGVVGNVQLSPAALASSSFNKFSSPVEKVLCPDENFFSPDDNNLFSPIDKSPNADGLLHEEPTRDAQCLVMAKADIHEARASRNTSATQPSPPQDSLPLAKGFDKAALRKPAANNGNKAPKAASRNTSATRPSPPQDFLSLIKGFDKSALRKPTAKKKRPRAATKGGGFHEELAAKLSHLRVSSPSIDWVESPE